MLSKKTYTRTKSLDAAATAKQGELARKLGDEIRRRRLAANMSQETLAEMANITTNYLSIVERAKVNATADALSRIAAGLSVKLSDLLVEIGE